MLAIRTKVKKPLSEGNKVRQVHSKLGLIVRGVATKGKATWLAVCCYDGPNGSEL